LRLKTANNRLNYFIIWPTHHLSVALSFAIKLVGLNNEKEQYILTKR